MEGEGWERTIDQNKIRGKIQKERGVGDKDETEKTEKKPKTKIFDRKCMNSHPEHT